MLISKIEIIPSTEIAIPSFDNTATKHIALKKKLDWDDNFSNIKEIKELKEGDVVIDAGAWIGDSTQVFLNQGCIVHAFEPRAETFVCLLNNCPKAHCYNIALGNAQTYGTDYRGGNTGGYSLIDGDKKSLRIDSFWTGKLDFLKIDVEGYELEVLKGGYETIKRIHPIIHIEINPSALMKFDKKAEEEINSILEYAGYYEKREVYNYSNQHWDLIVK